MKKIAFVADLFSGIRIVSIANLKKPHLLMTLKAG
jgi:hypothetical protein